MVLFQTPFSSAIWMNTSRHGSDSGCFRAVDLRFIYSFFWRRSIEWHDGLCRLSVPFPKTMEHWLHMSDSGFSMTMLGARWRGESDTTRRFSLSLFSCVYNPLSVCVCMCEIPMEGKIHLLNKTAALLTCNSCSLLSVGLRVLLDDFRNLSMCASRSSFFMVFSIYQVSVWIAIKFECLAIFAIVRHWGYVYIFRLTQMRWMLWLNWWHGRQQ